MAVLPNIPRARIVMDLIKDAEVATLASYADDKVDYLDGATSIKYVDAVLLVQARVSPEDLAEMPNEEKALRYLDALKEYHRRALKASRVPGLVDTYRETQAETVLTEAATDLGDDEYVAPEPEPEV